MSVEDHLVQAAKVSLYPLGQVSEWLGVSADDLRGDGPVHVVAESLGKPALAGAIWTFYNDQPLPPLSIAKCMIIDLGPSGNFLVLELRFEVSEQSLG
jgi:hypothetical protein